MIDVRFVIAHALWILGAAGLLAVFSYANWIAVTQGRRRANAFRKVWRDGPSVPAALVLIASGMLMMTGLYWWERAAWSILAGGALWSLWRRRRPG